VVTSEQNAPALHIVETLQQHEEGRLAAARLADETDALAGFDAQCADARGPLSNGRPYRNQPMFELTIDLRMANYSPAKGSGRNDPLPRGS
jgi:hypothetical protein